MTNTPPHDLVVASPRSQSWKRGGVVAVLVMLAGLLLINRSSLSAESLIAKEAECRSLARDFPVLLPMLVFLTYVGAIAFSIPGTTVLTLVSGWLFGFWTALVLASFGTSIGATASCRLSRTIFRESARRQLGSRLAMIEESLAQDGDLSLVSLRLLPQVPNFLINLAMGLTSYPLWRFYVFSQIGMFPATYVYVDTGARALDLRTLIEKGPSSLLTTQVLVTFSLLAILPWGVQRLVRLVRSKAAAESSITGLDLAVAADSPPPSPPDNTVQHSLTDDCRMGVSSHDIAATGF